MKMSATIWYTGLDVQRRTYKSDHVHQIIQTKVKTRSEVENPSKKKRQEKGVARAQAHFISNLNYTGSVAQDQQVEHMGKPKRIWA